MARARNIKPGFFVNEDIADCEPMARLLFISLWMLADREGRLENRPKKIKMQSFPYDDCDIADLLDQLSKRSFIFIYKVDDKSIIQINNWSKHQNPHHKEVESELPRFDKSKHELTTVQSKVMHDSNTVCDGYIPLSNTIRNRIFARDFAICNYCKSRDNLEIDHIIPISKGGNSTDDNLQVLCKNCNVLKLNNIVNHALSIRQGRVMLESCLSQDQVIESASCPTDSLNLIPDTGLLIADSSQQVAKQGKPAKKIKVELDYSVWPQQPSEQIFNDWIKMRRAKRASLSQTVLDSFGEEFKKAIAQGFTVDDCLKIAITSSWTGFKFDWVLNQQARGLPHAANQRITGTGRSEKKIGLVDRTREEASLALERLNNKNGNSPVYENDRPVREQSGFSANTDLF